MQQKTRALGAHGVWVDINMYTVRYLCVCIDIHLYEYPPFFNISFALLEKQGDVVQLPRP